MVLFDLHVRIRVFAIKIGSHIEFHYENNISKKLYCLCCLENFKILLKVAYYAMRHNSKTYDFVIAGKYWFYSTY